MARTNSNDIFLRNEKQKELLFEAIINSGKINLFQKKIKTSKHNAAIKKPIWVMLAIFAISGIGIFFIVNTLQVDEFPHMKTGYDVQNLRGDTVDTWLTWRIPNDDLFHVHVEKSDLLTDEMIQAIFDVIMSWDSIEIDDSLQHKGPSGYSSTYYKGWYGALQSISNDTTFTIPQNLHFNITEKEDGDILIFLTERSSPDGYSGYTTSIVDENDHQILKSKITIYNADKLSIEELKTIVRHELGHGFGLAHSSAPEDLMYPVIETDYPYISECDIDAIVALYDGSNNSKVICSK
jgi:hypothetical protein